MWKALVTALLAAALLVTTACASLNPNPEGQVIRTSLHHSVTVTTSYGSGSGVWVSDEHVLTARHVISLTDRDKTVRVQTFAGEWLDAEVVLDGGGPRGSTAHDWALLKVKTKRHHWAKVACGPVDYGQKVVSIGNALGITGLVAFIGQIQMKDYAVSERTERDDIWKHGFTLSAHGAPGVSGGPVFNMQGELIGINVAGLPPQILMVAFPTQYISALCGEHED